MSVRGPKNLPPPNMATRSVVIALGSFPPGSDPLHAPALPAVKGSGPWAGEEAGSQGLGGRRLETEALGGRRLGLPQLGSGWRGVWLAVVTQGGGPTIGDWGEI